MSPVLVYIFNVIIAVCGECSHLSISIIPDSDHRNVTEDISAL